MKKLLLVIAALVLALALVACGNDTTTTEPESSTTPDTSTEVTTTEGTSTTTKTPDSSTDSTPDETVEGIDIINNMDEPEYNAVNFNYDGNYNAFTFEDFHVDLDYNIALVIRIEECDAGLYQEFFLTLSEEDNSQYQINNAYKWEVVVDGTPIEIERITLANNKTSGWVRLDLGSDFSFDNYKYDENNEHPFDIRINIYGTNGKVAFYAWLTDPAYNGLYMHKKPAPTEMINDPSRPTNVEAIANNQIHAYSGPTPGSGETYENLFDGEVHTKLCAADEGNDNAIELYFTKPETIVGFSLVNGNDNESYNTRTLTAFELWASDDGQNWGDAPVASYDGTTDGTTSIDKSLISTNYLERYYALKNPVTATYFKLVTYNGDTYQISELIFYVEK